VSDARDDLGRISSICIPVVSCQEARPLSGSSPFLRIIWFPVSLLFVGGSFWGGGVVEKNDRIKERVSRRSVVVVDDGCWRQRRCGEEYYFSSRTWVRCSPPLPFLFTSLFLFPPYYLSMWIGERAAGGNWVQLGAYCFFVLFLKAIWGFCVFVLCSCCP